jgi:hypothetical protein
MIIRISCIVILALLVAACGFNAAVNKNVDKIASTASDIAEFDLPAGYSPKFSASLSNFSLVSYDPGDGHSHLYLIQSEKESESDKLANMVGQIAPGIYDPQTRMTIIETRSLTVREQEVTMVVSEGVTSERGTYRQAMVAFQGNGGFALVIISEPVARWNQEIVDDFIASIN